MAVLEFIPMIFIQWVFMVCFVCSSLGLGTLSLTCDPNDLLVLKEFAGNLTDGSIIPAWANESICCQWVGVKCGNGINGSAARRVIMLMLPSRGLKGMITRSLGNLDQLKLLDLSHNFLEGGIPTGLSNLHHLELLDLSFNMLMGPISGSLSGLKSIHLINISSNSFGGNIVELGDFRNLVVFNVSNNSLTGKVDNRICSSSSSIQILDLSANNFSGGLSEESLQNCSTSLKQLHVDCNSFSGHLPDTVFVVIFGAAFNL
uniref:Leucine-rich repeat-containing N-terminal plant-type domain-containing protein n=1 Tax=Nelumbo nucifera TaxID=4432 RepID=A0A822XUS8_NELNU|nr:TPA_asm: hypothetical protein HUJ06_024302 [Nelumbo nucifera]